MKTVLILNGQYLPGYKGGGPIQSCVNMIENLSDEYIFKVICADRDYKEKNPYENINVNEWNRVGSADVYYMSPEQQNLEGFKKIINETEYDVLYLNGFFSPIFTIKPLILRRLGKLRNKNAKIILTPRGDFTGGLENKKLKKYGYIALVKLIGLYNKLLWHATSEIEERDIKRLFPKAKTFVVPNLPAKFNEKEPKIEKEPGKLRLVFVSRIFPKKNIKFALEVLSQVREGEVIFDIYGPMEDKDYWKGCEELISCLPKNVEVKYCGEAPHNKIPEIFEQYHAFFFPTLGENYGHVIVEAMMNNCLCIMSRGVTPWDSYIDGIELGAELNNQIKFVDDIRKLVQANQSEMNKMLIFNNEYVQKNISSTEYIDDYMKLLNVVER